MSESWRVVSRPGPRSSPPSRPPMSRPPMSRSPMVASSVFVSLVRALPFNKLKGALHRHKPTQAPSPRHCMHVLSIQPPFFTTSTPRAFRSSSQKQLPQTEIRTSRTGRICQSPLSFGTLMHDLQRSAGQWHKHSARETLRPATRWHCCMVGNGRSCRCRHLEKPSAPPRDTAAMCRHASRPQPIPQLTLQRAPGPIPNRTGFRNSCTSWRWPCPTPYPTTLCRGT